MVASGWIIIAWLVFMLLMSASVIFGEGAGANRRAGGFILMATFSAVILWMIRAMEAIA